MKNNIDYYQHYTDADQHPKFKMLRVEFGWSGDGKFWALNNRIANAENCCLDVSKKYNRAAIANDLDFNLDDFDRFISFLRDECELIEECEPGVITTEIVQDNLKQVMSKRLINKKYYKKRLKDSDRNNQTSENEIQKSENIQSKDKVNKSKVNNNIVTLTGNLSSHDSDDAKTSQCPLKKIRELYNATLGDVLPKCKSTNQTFDKLLRARWREDSDRQNLEWWQGYFDYISESDFLMGRTDNPFTASFEWIIRPTNMSKIINGNYNNRAHKEETIEEYAERKGYK